MSKRLTESTKWADPWFRSLNPTAKLLWLWLLDNCDCAGIIRPDMEGASFQIGQAVDEKNLAELGNRLQPIADGKFYIPKFICFQYGVAASELSIQSTVHKGVMKALRLHGLLDKPSVSLCQPFAKPSESLTKPLPRALVSSKDKDKDKAQDPEGGAGGNAISAQAPVVVLKEFPEAMRTPRLMNQWQVWMTYRRGFKKPGNWATLFNEQVTWLSQFSEEKVFEILSASIRNGWQGLFEKEPHGNNGRSCGAQHVAPVKGSVNTKGF